MRRLWFLILFSLLTTHNIWAAECSAVFTEAASSHSAAGSISFASDARIEDSTGTLDIPSITDDTSGGSCDSQACASSGSYASAFNLPSFETSSSTTDVTITSGSSPYTLTDGEYRNVTVEEGNSLTFSSTNGTYIIDTLEIEDDSSADFASGDYWIDTLVLGAEAVLTVSGSDSVRIYTQSATIGEEADLNKGETADLLVVTSYGDITLGNNSETTGVLYANNTVALTKDATLTGTVSATDITMAGNTRIFYENVIEDVSFASLCGEPDPVQLAWYEFEETIWSGNAVTIDDSGQDNHASTLGDAVTTYPDEQVSCKVLDIPQNTSDSTIDAMDTGIDMNDVGNTGTISFWYRSNDDWTSGNSRQLFDASNDIAGEDKYFFMSVTNSGELRFAFEDSSDADLSVTSTINSFLADEWVHIAVTWDVANADYQMYINGASATSIVADALSTQALGELSSLYLGDNRSTYFGSNSSENSANGQFDGFRIYNYVQTLAQVSADSTSVSLCSYDPVGFYQFEETSWSSAGDVLDSSGSANHGDPLGDVLPWLDLAEELSCQGLEVIENSTNSVSAIDTGIDINSLGNDGTISFWYRSNEDWVGGSDRQLLDASSRSDGDKYFFLVLNSDGTLRFGLEYHDDDDIFSTTSAYSFSAGEWVHIAITWEPRTTDLEIYVNGTRAATTDSIEITLGGTLDELGTLHIGDNSTTYAVNGSSNDSADGYFDDVRVYDIKQTQTLIQADMLDTSPCISLDHYRIEHDTQGFTCEAKSVTIKACADEDCDIPYPDAVSITLSPTGWESSDTISFSSGETTASLNVTDEGSITFGQTSSSPSATLRCFNGDDETCDMDFVNAGFEFIGATESDKYLPDQVAEVNFSGVNLRAVKTDDDSGACVDLLDDGPHNINLSFDCTDPTSCKTNLVHGSTELTESVNETISLSFTGGIASLSNFNYSDAGRLTLYAQAIVEGATITSGNALVDVVPAYLTLTTDPAELTYIDSVDTDTFTAGVDFEFKLTAFGYEGAALANYVPGDLQIDMSRVAPTAAGSVDGSFTYTYDDTNTDGESSYTSNYDEVGRITLTVTDKNYLPDSYNAASEINGESSITLGNFIPAYFEIEKNSPELVDTCSTFSYVGQYIPLNENLTYTFTAKNAQGETTLNYGGNDASFGDDDWWQLILTDDHVFHTDNSGNDGEFWGQIAVSNTDNYDGSATYTITKPSDTDFDSYSTPLVKIPKDTTLLSEFATDFDVMLSNQTLGGLDIIADDNGVCFKTSHGGECIALPANDISGALMRYGRLALDSTYGPETEDLNVPIKTEYYDSGQWLHNTDDSCTAIDFDMGDSQIVLTDVEGSIEGLVGSVESTGELLMGEPVGDQLVLDAPGLGNVGQFIISLNPDAIGIEWPTHLNFNWNTDGDSETVIDSDDFPSATITFGQFRGNDRIIQWREVFN